MQSVSASTLGLAHTAWSGVDLHNMVGGHVTGSVVVVVVVVDDAVVLTHWLQQGNKTWWSCPVPIAFIFWQQAAEQVSASVLFAAW